MVYAEGTDLTKDLRGEKDIDLMNYVKDGYSQNLIVNQKKIKDQMTLFIQNRISRN